MNFVVQFESSPENIESSEKLAAWRRHAFTPINCNEPPRIAG
jgi:hypothetical protein